MASAATYNDDFYTWTFEQARFIREGRFSELDRENLVDEIECLGKEQFDKLRTVMSVLLTRMLLWDQQPEQRNRNSALSIEIHRIELEHVLDGNAGLRPLIAEAMTHAYELARLKAAIEIDTDEDTFPQECPYRWDDIVGRAFCPSPTHTAR